MTLVKLQWATPDIDAQIAFQARVSNPENQANPQIAGLLNYCMREAAPVTAGAFFPETKD